jgi:hypothetical protein
MELTAKIKVFLDEEPQIITFFSKKIQKKLLNNFIIESVFKKQKTSKLDCKFVFELIE